MRYLNQICRLTRPLKDIRAQYMAKWHNLYRAHQAQNSYDIYFNGFKPFFLWIVLVCQDICILDIDDQISTYVFTSGDIQAAQRIQTFNNFNQFEKCIWCLTYLGKIESM